MTDAVSLIRRVSCGARLQRDCAGDAAVEFALLIPFILLLIFGVYEFGRLYWIQNTIQFAAEQTARCVIANPASPAGTAVNISSGTCAFSNFLPAISSGNVSNVSPAVATCGSFGKCQTIKLTYAVPSTDMFNVIVTTFMGWTSHRARSNWTFTLTGQATVPIS